MPVFDAAPLGGRVMDHSGFTVPPRLSSPATILSAYRSVSDCERTVDMLAGHDGWMPWADRPRLFDFDPLWWLRSGMREEVRLLVWSQRVHPERWRAQRIAAYRLEHTRLIGVDLAALRAAPMRMAA